MRLIAAVVLSAAPLVMGDLPPPEVTAGKPAGRPEAKEVKAAGRSATLTSPVPCQWYAVSDLVDVVRVGDGKTCVVIPPGDGRWRVIAYSAKGGEATAPAVVDVVIGGGTPPAPLPPGPTPPGPVVPPADPFTARVKAAYDADPAEAVTKKGQAQLLQVLYAEAVKLAAKPEYATGAQLVEEVRGAAQHLNVTGLTGVRTLVAEELGRAADVAAPLTADSRAAIAGVYKRAAAGLPKPE